MVGRTLALKGSKNEPVQCDSVTGGTETSE